MAQVICSLENASEEISGVKFSKHQDGMISEDISDEQAELFASIPGYTLVGQKSAEELAAEAERQAAELKALATEAVELGIQVKSNWKADRLRAEVEKAKAAKA